MIIGINHVCHYITHGVVSEDDCGVPTEDPSSCTSQSLHCWVESYFSLRLCLLCVLHPGHSREAVTLHASGCDSATQLFNLRLYVCFCILHASGTLLRMLLLHACGCFWGFLCTKHCQLSPPSSGASKKRCGAGFLSYSCCTS